MPKRRWRWITSILVLVAGAGIAWLCRGQIFPALANLWIVSETPAKADAIVVLGGRPDVRPFEAARLYHAGIAKRILYMDVKLPPAAQMGITLSEAELTRRILLSNNIPESAITLIGKHVASTYDESCAVKSWMDSNGAKTIVIPTDLFPSRRTRWIFNHELKGADRKVYVEAVAPRDYSASNWWHSEEALIAFESEVIKLLYYRCKY